MITIKTKPSSLAQSPLLITLLSFLVAAGCGGGGSGDDNSDNNNSSSSQSSSDNSDSGSTSSDVGDLSLTGVSDIMQMHLNWEGANNVDILYSSDPGCDWDNYASCDDSGAIVNAEGGELTLGAVEDDFDPDTGWYFVAESEGQRSNRASARPTPPDVESSVSALVAGSDRLYLGGDFTRVSLSVGGGVPLTTDGEPSGPLPFMDRRVYAEGRVYASVPDGEGGWYVGGNYYTSSAHGSQPSLSRIRADGTVDTRWRARVSGTVEALAVHNGKVYVGGYFDHANGESRSNLAVFDAQTGELNPDVKPDLALDPGDVVQALAVDDGRIFVGGHFTEVDGEPRGMLAVLDAETGELNEWNPRVNNNVVALVVADGNLYVGGPFDEIGGESLSGLVAFDVDTLELSHSEMVGNGDAYTVTVAGNRLYVGGSFTRAGGLVRAGLAAYELDDGHIELDTDWNPGTNGPVRSLAIVNDKVYVGGSFGYAGSEVIRSDGQDLFDPEGPDFEEQGSSPRGHLAAFDAETGELTDWDPGANLEVYALCASGGKLYAGGRFSGIGGLSRSGLAAFDSHTGIPLSDWELELTGEVHALVLHEERLYVAGSLAEDPTETPSELVVALAADSGALVSDWEREMNGTVATLAVYDGKVYAGGQFTEVDGESRQRLAAFDAASGALDGDWRPGVGGTVRELVAGNGKVYIAGAFAEANGEARSALAAFATDDGTLDENLDVSFDGDILALLFAHDHLYVGGSYTSVDDQEDQNYLAAFDADTGVLNEERVPDFGGTVEEGTVYEEGDVFTLAHGNGRIYAGGHFTTVNGVERDRIAAFEADTGDLDENWSPDIWFPRRAHWSLVVGGGRVYPGGSFTRAGERHRNGLSAFTGETGELLW